jgi:hypothetical protein
MVEQELLCLAMHGYLLGSSFCLEGLQKGGAYIFVKTNQHFSEIDISHHCREQDYEICEIQLLTKTSHNYIKLVESPFRGS